MTHRIEAQIERFAPGFRGLHHWRPDGLASSIDTIGGMSTDLTVDEDPRIQMQACDVAAHRRGTG